MLAWLILAAGIAGAIFALVALRGTAEFELEWTIWTVGAGLLSLFGVSWFILLYAIGSVLSLLVEIEQNTRLLAARGVER
ncbi:MAG: hypothetical protein CVU38_16545 [Chloroflexi bacterium HGW-Chloroflexi-1]|nr:MAG: hypothetical protein CVU38_16545 [Chloroflexi bacterium HGW-Chloroflexi-1]